MMRSPCSTAACRNGCARAGRWRPVRQNRGSARFTPRFRPALVCGLDAVRAALATGSRQLVDARSAARFAGSEPEFRPGLRSGHMPGAKNLPYGDLLNPDGTFRPASEIRERFRAAGVDLER